MALPFQMKHSTNVVAIIILSIFEGDVRKGTSEGGEAFYERSGKTNIWKLKIGNKGGVCETCPHIKMLLDRLCSGQMLILHHIATD